MRTSATLQAGYQLQENSVDAIGQASLIPLGFERVFLALVQQQCLHVITGNRITGQIEMPVPQSLQYAETLSATAALQQSGLSFRERQHPGVALHRRLFTLKRDALL